ncbi:hypothetical protein NL108_017942 [Boleophthalmus pectinirostris]|nr:hypothetical protein NL108_017942 [Boleophthalmus pectinirostris]
MLNFNLFIYLFILNAVDAKQGAPDFDDLQRRFDDRQKHLDISRTHRGRRRCGSEERRETGETSCCKNPRRRKSLKLKGAGPNTEAPELHAETPKVRVTQERATQTSIYLFVCLFVCTV